MWWQFKEVHPSIKLHLCHCVDIQLFVRVDRHKKSTNICLQGERPYTGRKSVPALEWQLLKEESSTAGHYVKTTEKDGTEWEKKKSTTTSLLRPHKKQTNKHKTLIYWLYCFQTSKPTLNFQSLPHWWWSSIIKASLEPYITTLLGTTNT